MSDFIRTWPKKIWLQHTDEEPEKSNYAELSENEIIWCSQKVFEWDIEYVRADIYNTAIWAYDRYFVENEKMKAELAETRELIEAVKDYFCHEVPVAPFKGGIIGYCEQIGKKVKKIDNLIEKLKQEDK